LAGSELGVYRSFTMKYVVKEVSIDSKDEVIKTFKNKKEAASFIKKHNNKRYYLETTDEERLNQKLVA